MRIVRWSPQERVDVADLTASDFLVLGEFRRMTRGVLLGEDVNRIVKGFKVEASAVPDSLITVKLDPGGGNPLSFAIGAEAIGTRTDYGQIIGGDNSDGQLEGNAQQTIDFTGQPNGTYTVQMRFLLSEGVSDNRAFWNAGSNAEFISIVNTRHLPTFALRISGAPSNEWIDLATVNWTGATITSANITDIRTFAFEGNAPYTVATQSTAGAYDDFNRSSDRAANGVNAVYPALRALARQVMDLKGEDVAGGFNWWNRVFKAPDGAASLFATEKTKTLRSVDLVTYTIGDGVTTFGDFNGADGLESCLQHVDLLDAAGQAPERVVIVLRTNNTSSFTWNINTAHTYTSTGVEIRGEAGTSVGGRAFINLASVPLTNVALNVQNKALTLRNIALTLSVDVGAFASSFRLHVHDCYLQGYQGAGAATAVLYSGGHGLLIENSHIRGKIQALAVDSTVAENEPSVIRNSSVVGAIECLDGALSEKTMNLLIDHCTITQTQSHCFNLGGAVAIGDRTGVTIRSSRIFYHGSRDGIYVNETSGTAGEVRVEDCVITNATASTHAVTTGNNGAKGTGWCFFASGPTGGTNGNTRIFLRNNTFVQGDSADAGCIGLFNARGFAIEGNEFSFCEVNTGVVGAYGSCILIEGDAAGYRSQGAIKNNTLHRFGFTGGADFGGLRLNRVNNVIVEGNTFVGSDFDYVDISGRNFNYGNAIELRTVRYVSITNNIFEAWDRDAAAASRCIRVNAGPCRYVTVNGNIFRENGEYCVQNAVGTEYWTVNDNIVDTSGVTNGEGFFLEDAVGTVVNNNVWRVPTAGFTGVDFVDAVNCVAMGNRGANADIKRNSGTVRGYNEAGQDLNLVNAYS